MHWLGYFLRSLLFNQDRKPLVELREMPPELVAAAMQSVDDRPSNVEEINAEFLKAHCTGSICIRSICANRCLQ